VTNTELWKHRETAETLKKTNQLTLTDPEGAQKAAEWKIWREESFNDWALMHALGLHRDPKRGKSHIVIKRVQYAPKASKELRYKFRVIECGVFRISDLQPEIEGLMGLDRGEGTEYIQGLLEGLNRQESDGTWRIPMVDLSFGDDVETWLGSSAYNCLTSAGMCLIGYLRVASITEGALRTLPYNPKWRGMFNLGGPPVILRFKRPELKDQEHIF
jgi:hypothetical protein